MKKLIAGMAAAVMLLSLTGCTEVGKIKEERMNKNYMLTERIDDGEIQKIDNYSDWYFKILDDTHVEYKMIAKMSRTYKFEKDKYWLNGNNDKDYFIFKDENTIVLYVYANPVQIQTTYTLAK